MGAWACDLSKEGGWPHGWVRERGDALTKKEKAWQQRGSASKMALRVLLVQQEQPLHCYFHTLSPWLQACCQDRLQHRGACTQTALQLQQCIASCCDKHSGCCICPGSMSL